MIEIDGSKGEGGGQILRTALTLSMITGQPFKVSDIRKNRPKPGLMRQHLVCVQAAAKICGAVLSGDEIGSRSLEFIPGKIRGGDYNFAIGSAGSTTLVLQTVVPALLFADVRSTVTITGGTHNPKAPPSHFLERCYGRMMAKMGANIDVKLDRFGFYPAGGGIISATVEPCMTLSKIDLIQRGEILNSYAESFVAAIHHSVALRELNEIEAHFGWDRSRLKLEQLPFDQGPGNTLMLTVESENVTELFVGFGEKHRKAEDVARAVIAETDRYIQSGAAVSEYLADQLMLPMALAGGGSFTVDVVSEHARTNAQVIGEFLPITFMFESDGSKTLCKIKLR